jgi:hypothetical protein
MTFCRGLDGSISGISLVSDLARSVIQEQFDREREYQELILWLLFIIGASLSRQTDDAWSIAKTAETMQTLGLQTWEDVAQIVSKFPWVGAVHDNAGQWYYTASCSTLLFEAASE